MWQQLTVIMLNQSGTCNPVLCLPIRLVKCLASVWIHHVPHLAAVIQLSAKESAVPHAMVSGLSVNCLKISSFLLPFLSVFCCFLVFHCSDVSRTLCLLAQNVSMTAGCMLMEKCSAPLEVDPACSARVGQVWTVYSRRQQCPKTVQCNEQVRIGRHTQRETCLVLSHVHLIVQNLFHFVECSMHFKAPHGHAH